MMLANNTSCVFAFFLVTALAVLGSAGTGDLKRVRRRNDDVPPRNDAWYEQHDPVPLQPHIYYGQHNPVPTGQFYGRSSETPPPPTYPAREYTEVTWGQLHWVNGNMIALITTVFVSMLMASVLNPSQYNFWVVLRPIGSLFGSALSFVRVLMAVDANDELSKIFSALLVFVTFNALMRTLYKDNDDERVQPYEAERLRNAPPPPEIRIWQNAPPPPAETQMWQDAPPPPPPPPETRMRQDAPSPSETRMWSDAPPSPEPKSQNAPPSPQPQTRKCQNAPSSSQLRIQKSQNTPTLQPQYQTWHDPLTRNWPPPPDAQHWQAPQRGQWHSQPDDQRQHVQERNHGPGLALAFPAVIFLALLMAKGTLPSVIVSTFKTALLLLNMGQFVMWCLGRLESIPFRGLFHVLAIIFHGSPLGVIFHCIGTLYGLYMIITIIHGLIC